MGYDLNDYYCCPKESLYKRSVSQKIQNSFGGKPNFYYDDQAMDSIIQNNTLHIKKQILESKVIKNSYETNSLKIVLSQLYLDSGKVEEISENIPQITFGTAIYLKLNNSSSYLTLNESKKLFLFFIFY